MVSRMDRMEAGTLATLLLLTGAGVMGVTGLLRVMLTPASSLWLKMDKTKNLKLKNIAAILRLKIQLVQKFIILYEKIHTD